uniref:hypothetical protein n=1 Tax=Shewanella gaetbuli TaxID=220752 RepID=UPI003B5AB889
MLRNFTLAIMAIAASACSELSTNKPVNDVKAIVTASGSNDAGYIKRDQDHIKPVGFNGKVYYVSESGDDKQDGLSIASPLKTLQAAEKKTQPGDTVYVLNGTYTNEFGKHILKITQSGTAENWIRYMAYPDHKPVLRSSSTGGIYIHGASYLLIDGLTLIGPQDDITLEEAIEYQDIKEHPVATNTGIALKPLKLENGKYQYGHHLVIQNNNVSKFNCNGIGFTRGDYLLVQNNKVHHNAFYSPWACSGISTWSNWNFDNNQDIYRVIFRNNETYNNYNHIKFWMQNKITDGNGIIIDALMLDQNVINDGLDQEYSGHVLVSNNISHHNGGRGINIYHSDNVDIIHNTTYANGQHPNINSELGIGSSNNISLFNNIFYGQKENNMFLFYYSEDIYTDANLFYGFSELGMPIPDDELAIFKRPHFKDTINLDFSLTSQSPAVNRANPLMSVPEDFNYHKRDQQPDLGAFEAL